MAHISNPAIRSLIEKKIYYVVLKLFRNCQPNSLVKPIIVDLLSKQKLLLRLLKQL